MRRRPLFALGTLVLTMTLLELHLGMGRLELTVLAGVATVVMTLGCFLSSLTLTRFSAAVAIAGLTLLRLGWAEPEFPVDTTMARTEGRVTEVRPTEHGGWFCVVGEIDPVSTPACSCTVIVHLHHGQELPPVGCTIVVTGHAAPSRIDPGWPPIERAWCRSRAATFQMRATQVHILTPPSGYHVGLGHLRRSFIAAINRHFPPRTALVMQAMLLGDRTALTPELRAASIATGTAHLFAVSGLHVGTVLGLVLFVTGGSVRRWGHWVFAVATIGLFVAITGGEPPALRAVIMAAGAGLGRLREKNIDLVNLLGLSILIELCIWPELILRPSFLLSTAVTAGLLWWVRPLTHTLKRVSSQRWWQRVSPVISVHLVAAAASALPGAVLFGSISLTAPLINLFVVPMMMASLVATIGVLTAGWMSSALAGVLAWTPIFLVSLSESVIRTASQFSIGVPEHVLPLVAIVVTGTVPWLQRSKRVRDIVVRLCLTSLFIACLLQIPSSSTCGVIGRRIRDRVEVRVSAPAGTRTFTVGQRYGRPFVRSYNDAHPSNTGP